MATSNYLSVDDVATILCTTKNYVYQLVHKKLLPCYRPFGGRLLFDADELEAFIKSKRSSTADELEARAVNHLNHEASR